MLLRRFAFLIVLLTSLVSLHGAEEAPSFEIKSTFTTGGRISGNVLTDPRDWDSFLVFSEDRYLYSFHSSGEFRSRKRISGTPLPFHVQGPDGVIYKYFDNNTLKAINIRGDIIWSERINSRPVFDPVINSMGNIITVSENIIISYSYMGRKRWEVGTDLRGRIPVSQSRIFSTPLAAAAGGIVYAGMSDGTIAVIDNNGQVIRASQVSSSGITAISISNNRIFVSDRRSNLFLLDNHDLSPVTIVELRAPASHIIASGSGNVIAVLTEAGNIHLFNNALSQFPARIRSAGFTGSPLYFGNNFYFVRNDGFIVKFDISRRTMEELLISSKAVSGLRNAANNMNRPLALSASRNMIIAGGLDWNLYFIEEKNYKSTQGAESSESYTFIRSAQDNINIVPDMRHLIYINELSQQEDLVSREKAFALLNEISFARITANDERYIISILNRIAFGSGRIVSGTGIRIEGSAIMRNDVASVASKIGTAESINILRNMLGTETSPVTAALIIEKLGKAGTDPYSESIRLFDRAYSRFPNDLAVSKSIIAGIENIHRYQGFIYANEGVNLLYKMLERTKEHDLNLNIMDALKTLEQ